MTEDNQDFEVTEAVLYELGHPDLTDIKEGILEITGTDLIFKEEYKDRVYFSIPLDQIGEVKTEGASLGGFMLSEIASVGALRNHLRIRFQMAGRDYMVVFTNPLYNKKSTICERLKKKIIDAKTKRRMA